MGGVGGSFQAQRIKGRNEARNSIGIGIGIGMGLWVLRKPSKVLVFTSLASRRRWRSLGNEKPNVPLTMRPKCAVRPRIMPLNQ